MQAAVPPQSPSLEQARGRHAPSMHVSPAAHGLAKLSHPGAFFADDGLSPLVEL
jgi:hypothetical protein